MSPTNPASAPGPDSPFSSDVPAPRPYPAPGPGDVSSTATTVVPLYPTPEAAPLPAYPNIPQHPHYGDSTPSAPPEYHSEDDSVGASAPAKPHYAPGVAPVQPPVAVLYPPAESRPAPPPEPTAAQEIPAPSVQRTAGNDSDAFPAGSLVVGLLVGFLLNIFGLLFLLCGFGTRKRRVWFMVGWTMGLLGAIALGSRYVRSGFVS